MRSLKERIAIEQRAADGEFLQWTSEMYPEWQTIDHTISPSFIFDWLEKDYRIKQSPMEFWVNVYDDSIYVHKTQKRAESFQERNVEMRTIKVREVTE